MNFESKELDGDLDSLWIVSMQNPKVLSEMTDLARRDNYLFSMLDMVVRSKLRSIDRPGTDRDFLVGMAVYQALISSVFTNQTAFSRPPEDTAAHNAIIDNLSDGGESILDRGIDMVDDVEIHAPRLNEATREIIGSHVDSRGSCRIAMGGVAIALSTHVKAEQYAMSPDLSK